MDISFFIFSIYYRYKLAETYVGNHLTTDILVQLGYQFLTAHRQIGAQGRTGETHKERLVINIGVQRVALSNGTRYLGPRLYQPLLQQWHL